ncbi:hypothetical protein MRX96_018419 [Rhipicephalus microplus]
MEREEKALDVALDAMISRTQDLKNSIASFIIKLETEYETLQWPSVLNSFALLSGQLNTLMKVLRNEKTPPLRNRILLPLFLNPERDEELAKQIASLNKIVNTIETLLKTTREDWESTSGQRSALAQTSSLADTNALIGALSTGKGLRPSLGSPKSQSPLPTAQSRGAKAFSMHPAGKMPSSIKTNIKSAGASHPYGR